VLRLLLALDKFKGSLTAKQACEAVIRGIRRAKLDAEIKVCPIADGGEGFTDAVVTAIGGEWHELVAHDAQGRRIPVRYALIDRENEKVAVMEMSAASGLALVGDLPLDPRTASTSGTGEMMLHALECGANRILIGIGGSATNDGGTGMASVLGYQFLDEDENLLTELPADLEKVHRIAKEHRVACDVDIASDVTNPLLGEHGATRVYGGQKGVKDFEFYEERLEKLADLVARDLGCDHRNQPGAGAAGGLGFGLLSFCGAEMHCGFDLVADITGLEKKIQEADIIITGEGKLDGQTLHGKGPMGVARMARAAGKRVIGIGGIIEDNPNLHSAFDGLWSVKPESMSVKEAIARAAELLEETVAARADSLKALGASSS
jgi:glycerate kinase